jgi:hypothetical protein
VGLFDFDFGDHDDVAGVVLEDFEQFLLDGGGGGEEVVGAGEGVAGLGEGGFVSEAGSVDVVFADELREFLEDVQPIDVDDAWVVANAKNSRYSSALLRVLKLARVGFIGLAPGF